MIKKKVTRLESFVGNTASVARSGIIRSKEREKGRVTGSHVVFNKSVA